MTYFSPVENTTGYVNIPAAGASLSFKEYVGMFIVIYKKDGYKKDGYKIQVNIQGPLDQSVVTKLTGEKRSLVEFAGELLAEIFNNEFTAEEICTVCRFNLAKNKGSSFSYKENDGPIVYLY
jgi:hypothetical protein